MTLLDVDTKKQTIELQTPHLVLRIVKDCPLTYPIVGGACHLLGEAHEQQVGSLGDPFCVQLLLRGASYGVVRGLQAAEELRERIVYFCRDAGHFVGERPQLLGRNCWQFFPTPVHAAESRVAGRRM